eukprot:CAMPEP_0113584308 /NCGR_PEP_ID=MMETSP0015_2-20120614/33028_1 /TAXON_ID=2838 /ORGANISM="Odontella" /LENGTH=1570 /DNA_ID=CAMNT_0000489337 /DNA_START=20 /DNA_END=4732 /DNA_ORIENTATION=+ /assembly_acc=CAM_ASM_000160
MTSDAAANRRSRSTRRRRPGRGDHIVIPLRSRRSHLRLDVLPFAIVYAALIAWDFKLRSSEDDDDESSTTAVVSEYLALNVCFGLALLSHLGLFLATRWRVSVRAAVGFARLPPTTAAAERMGEWTHALVTPSGPGGGGSADVVPVTMHRYNTSGGDSATVAVADFHNTALRCTGGGDGEGGGKDDEMDGIWGSAASVSSDAGGGKGGAGSSGRRANFHRLHFPVDMPLPFYSPASSGSWRGHSTPASLSRTLAVYGPNALPIALPPFLHLLSEQLVAPFFLFQLFCVLLWSLDEYWYYAIFTLFTLVMFECTVAYNRLKGLQRLRETMRPPFEMWVYREKKWGVCRSDEIVCGDVVSLSSPDAAVRSDMGLGRMGGNRKQQHDHEGGRHVPADCLLLGGGTAVVDEAALTGESVPQMKESVESILGALDTGDGNSSEADAGDVRLDVDDPLHRKSVLFGGTKLVNHCPSPADDDDDDDDNGNGNSKGQRQADAIPPPPDGGLTVLILRTGFDTSQGSLLRTMVHTSVRGNQQSQSSEGGGGGVDGFDTFVFICILLVCAVLSSSTVLSHGWDDPTRNRFKLLLHVVIIVTSVVPPELPMELSLAVTSSVADLIHRCGVFCTEPFRIPMAGTVDVCCFDKTGTITSDEMVLRGVRLPPLGAAADGSGGKGDEMECSDGSEAGGNDDLALPRSSQGGTNHEADEDGDGAGVKSSAPGREIPPETLRVMVACQSLASTNPQSSMTGVVAGGNFLDGVVGDPLERAVLRSCRFMLAGNDAVVPVPDDAVGMMRSFMGQGSAAADPGAGRAARIWHRFAFTSKLKRMTVLASDVGTSAAASEEAVWALSKGAPETMRGLFDPKTVPVNYAAVSRRHMGMGQRVLAMGYRNLGKLPTAGKRGGAHARSQIKERTRGGERWSRSHLEKDLIFAGFLVLDCPLKSDSKKVIRELTESGHRCVMITGDAVLTAAEVARSVGILGGDGGKGKKKKKGSAATATGAAVASKAETYELREMKGSGVASASSSYNDLSGAAKEHGEDGGAEVRPLLDSGNGGGNSAARFAFVPLHSSKTGMAGDSDSGAVDSEKCIAYVPSNLPVVRDMLSRGEIAGVCVGGDALGKIAAEAVRRSRRLEVNAAAESLDADDDAGAADSLLHPASVAELSALVPLVSVFARHAPRQKEAVLAALNASGNTTLMCGDGTNDVGALKMAHVGVSIVSVPDLEAKKREGEEGVERLREEERRERKRAKKSKKKKGDKGGADSTLATKKKKRERKANLEKHLRAMAEAEEELAYVNLGDASVASPFTARTMSIRCTCDILQRGRCTLVTMLQIYKILGVNCLVNALVLTKLHMAGAKQGDRQLTVVGVVVAALFLFVTKGKPLPSLSSRRPPSSVLCAQALLSVALQFAVHFAAISAVADLSVSYLDPHDPSLVPDGPFHANALNTSTFLVTVLATVNTFAVNYRGRPFVEDLRENTLLLRSVQVCYGTLFACATEVFPPLNDLMQLSELPEETAATDGSEEGGGGTGAMSALLMQGMEAVGFKAVLCAVMVLDSVVAFAVERAIVRIFEGKRTSV